MSWFGLTEVERAAFERALEEINANEMKQLYNSKIYKWLEKKNEEKRRKKAQRASNLKNRVCN